MLPTIHLGPWQIGTYGLLALVGLLVSGFGVIHRLLWLDQPRRVILIGFVLVILSGLAGTVFMSWLITSYRVARSGLLAQPEGYSVVWTLSFGTLVLIVYTWWQGESVGRVLDLVALPIPLGLAIGRLGCAAAGCCYGRPTDSWLGVYLPDHVGMWAVRYPTQLLSAAVDLFIFIALVAIERYGMRRVGRSRTWPFNGFSLLLALILFSSKRFVMGFLRESGPVLLGPLTWMHLSALIVLVGATGFMAWGLVRTWRGSR
jgi:phosphatidylglycerol:prolipoprotein diacylglycerol transferase